VNRITSSALIMALLAAGLTWSGCSPRPEIMPTPARNLEGAWVDFQHELRGLDNVRYWDVGSGAIRELPALKNLTWTRMVSAMGGNSWADGNAIMRCANAELEGTVMTLTLRYGLVLHEQTDDDHPNCWSGACEVRLTLDLSDVNVFQPRHRRTRSGWIEFVMTDTRAQIAERDLISGDWTRCRMDRGLLTYGTWGGYHEPEAEHRVRPCFIPAELRPQFEVLVERAKRVGSAG